MSISKKEQTSIDALSFVPENIEAVCGQAKQADALIVAKKRGPMLSKLHFLSPSMNLCPESLNPDDTILNKLARGEIGPGTTIMDDYFAVINDRNMPLGGASCGVNGVLFNCNSAKYGDRRINLFGSTVETTLELARDYMAFRNSRLPEIFQMYVHKLTSFLDHWKIDPTKDETLSSEYREAYSGTCQLMSDVLAALTPIEDLQDSDLRALGISVVSFCQTWQKGDDLCDAQFSVMSPHFQTRFYIEDPTKLPTNAQTHVKSYSKMIDFFTTDMLSKNYAKSFVNVDQLVSLSPSESAYHNGLQAGSAIVGIGPFTSGIVLQIQSEHPLHAEMLSGKYKLIGNHPIVSSLLMEHMPVEPDIMSTMITKLCSGKSRTFEEVSRAILEVIGPRNKELLDKHLFATSQWKVVLKQ